MRLIARLAMTLTLSLAMVPSARAAPDSLFQDGSHPDLANLQDGIHAWHDGYYGDALASFRRAARYANKTAQYLIGLMYENGQGVAADPARAYAWLDLAGERGYAEILVRREQVWNRLDVAQRKQAIAVGRSLYAEYGDSVAKPRLERRLLAAHRRATGSHTGFSSDNLIVKRSCLGAAAGVLDSLCQVGGYYDRVYWDADRYWQAEDALWNGQVTVGPISAVGSDGAKP